MYQKLSDCVTDEDRRKYYAAYHGAVRDLMQRIWDVRGWTTRWEWHNGICDDCEFLFDAEGNMRGSKDNSYPRNSEVLSAIEEHKLTVTHTKKSVKISNKQADKPVEGKSHLIVLAYLNWLLAFETQQAEEKQCAAQ